MKINIIRTIFLPIKKSLKLKVSTEEQAKNIYVTKIPNEALYAPNMLIETELNWAYAVLGVSFLIESVVLGKAINTALEGAYANKMTLRTKFNPKLLSKAENIRLFCRVRLDSTG